MKKIIWIVVFLCFYITKAQETYLNNDINYRSLVDRYAILHSEDTSNFIFIDAYYSRKDVALFAQKLILDTLLSNVDIFNIKYLMRDNHEFLNDSLLEKSKHPIFKKFYLNPTDLYYVKTKYFSGHFSPVLNLSTAKDFKQEKNLFLSTRGFEIRGNIDNKIGFYSFIADNQAIFPTYVYKDVYARGALYGSNFWKEYKEEGFDFLSARGYLTAQLTKHVHAQLGYDRNFFGNGYRSLILSDVGAAYSFFKLRTNVWKLEYTNVFADLTANISKNSSGLILNAKYPRKQLAFHHLGVKIRKNVKVGLFEAVMYGKPDSLGGSSFNVNYLNPVIFYRSIEQNMGSAGNALLGMDFQWLFLKHFSMYGQIVLDEFKFSHIKAQNGWWANKQAGQVGLKYINVAGVKNLDIQGEINFVRPYTYGHKDVYTNYTHFNQMLAHPTGANLYEFIGIVRAQPIPKLNLVSKMFFTKVGKDTVGVNWGSDPQKSYTDRIQEFGNETTQGFTSTIFYWDLTLSYQLKHNLFIDLQHVYRKEENELSILSNENQFLSVGLRLNMRQRLNEF